MSGACWGCTGRVVLGFWAWALWAFAREPWAPHGRVGEAALGNSVFRVECICMGLGRVMRLLFTLVVLVGPLPVRSVGLVLWVRSLGSRVLRSWSASACRPAGFPGPVGFVLWAPGSACPCWQVLYLVLRVRARGLIHCLLNSVHTVPIGTSTVRACTRAVAVWSAGKPKN